MKTAILYGAQTRLTRSHQLVRSLQRSEALQGEVWVRMWVIETDIATALELASPMEGETVLNTFELKDEVLS